MSDPTKACPGCGAAQILVSDRRCLGCRLAEAETEIVAMRRFRDNAIFRETLAIRERDEARAERDALARALTRLGGNPKKTAARARANHMRTSTVGMLATAPDQGKVGGST